MYEAKEAYRLSPLEKARGFKWGVYDIEAEDWWDLVMVGVYDGKSYFCLRSIEELLDHCLRPKYRGWRFFAHNGGRYDCNFIFDYLRKTRPANVRFRFYCAGSRVVSFTVQRGKEWVRFCDSYQLLPSSQARLAESFGVEHQKGELDIYSIDYNRNDCLGLYEILEMFFDQTGVMAETFASHALTLWRKDFQKDTLYKPARWIEDRIRVSYSAGRVEIFHRAGEVACYDVNSMFPWAMCQPVPVHYRGLTREIDHREDRMAFLEAEVIYPETEIPALPYRHGKLLFPVGTFLGVWTNWELQQALEDGASVSVKSGYMFATETIFEGYVQKWFKVKRDAPDGDPMRIISKFLLNSLYGKFGQTRDKRVFALWEHQKGYSPLYDEEGRETGICFKRVEAKSAHLLPHISAAITSRSRIRLLKALRTYSPYYCDTDCIFTDVPLPVSSDLGGWSKELPLDRAEFYQPKLYRHGEKWKSKGLSKANKKHLTDYVKGTPYTFNRHGSVLESTRKSSGACRMVEVTRTLRDEFPKRPWVGDNDTRPWRIKGETLQ